MPTESDFVEFHRHYCPGEVEGVPLLLEQNLDWDALWERLVETYGPWPAPPREVIKCLEAVVGKAVIVGIDYVGTGLEAGSVESAKRFKEGLFEEGFTGETRLLCDDGNVDAIPTRSKILEAVEWLAMGSRPGHVAMFIFIGKVSHGGHKETEGSGCLYPADHRTVGSIRGADIITQLSEKLASGGELFVLCDARPLGYNIGLLQHQLVSFLEGDVQPRVVSRCTTIRQALKVTILSVHKPRLNLETATYDLAAAFVASMVGLRRKFEDYPSLADARERFLKGFRDRFGSVVSWEGVSSLTMQRYCHIPLEDLKVFFAKMGGKPSQVGVLQNTLRTAFKKVTQPPFTHLATPPLSTLIHAIRDVMQSASIAPMVTSNQSFPTILPKPFLTQSAGWETFGIFPAQPSTTQTHSWTPKIGYISSGGDILNSPLSMTLSDALCLAARTPECKGFCYKPVGEGEVLQVYFKDKFDLNGRGWVTYAPVGEVLGGPAWCPPTAKEVVQSVVAEMIWKERPGGMTNEESAEYHKERVEKIVRKSTRNRLVNFYQHYMPAKLPSVVPTLMEFVDMEEVMFSALTKKYGPEPPDTLSSPPPEGWVLVESPAGDLFYKHKQTGRKQWHRPEHSPSSSVL